MKPFRYEKAAAGTPPTPPASPSDGYPTNGNPGVTPATEPGEFWFHQLDSEMLALLVDGGQTPSQGTLTQIRDAVRAMIAASINNKIVPVRQTVLQGPCNADGTPNLGGATGATSVTTSNIAAGALQLIATAASGFGSNGQADVVGATPSNLTWTGLNATSSTMYLYVDIAAGALTPGVSTLAPIYTDSSTLSTTNNQWSYSITDGFGTVGNGTVAVLATRVYVGEVDINGSSVVSAIRWYAYRGRFTSLGNAVVATVPQSKAHNIGTYPKVVSLHFRCTSADAGYAVGDRFQHSCNADSPGFEIGTMWNSPLNVGFVLNTGVRISNKTTSLAVTIDLTKWVIDYEVERGYR